MESRDTSGRAGLAGLLAANALTALLALWQGWSLILLLWPYWLQSLAIGWFARQRVLALPDAPGAASAADEARSRRILANLMSVHYGIFLFAGLAFLVEFSGDVRPLDWLLVAIAGGSFAWGHQRSKALNLDADRAGGRNPAALMFLPYARVLPMILAIVAGALAGAEGWVVLGFCALKTAADAVMHVVEHRWLRGGSAA